MSSDEEISALYQVLGNPVRRKIIEILGSRGGASLRELTESLNASSGSVYYNIELLGDLVKRDVGGKFTLTDRGWMAYRLLMDGKERISELKYYSRIPIPLKVRSKLSTILFPRWLLLSLYEGKILRFIIPIIVLAFGFFTCYWTNIELCLFSASYKPLQWPIYTGLKFLASWLIVYFAFDILPLLIHGRVGGRGILFFGLSIATIPLTIIPYIMISNLNFTIQGILIIALQFSSCLLASSTVSAAKGLGLERAFLLTVFIVYLNLTLNVVFRF
jgi:DNA-binding transcriptional ArsR family regulator